MSSYLKDYSMLVVEELRKIGEVVSDRSIEFFDLQKEVLSSKADTIVLITGRRSGKTVSIQGFVEKTLKKFTNGLTQEMPLTGGTFIIGAPTKDRSYDLHWKALCETLDELRLSYNTNLQKKTISIPILNIKIIMVGLKDINSASKVRGLPPVIGVAIDEVQDVKDVVLEYFLEESGMPLRLDLGCQFLLSGTPPDIKEGFLQKIFDQGRSNDNDTGISSFHWTLFQNPYLNQDLVKSIIDKELARLDMTWETMGPAQKREILGEFVYEKGRTILEFNGEKNIFSSFPKEKSRDYWNFIIGIDLGYKDSDAIAVLAYSHFEDKIYLVEEIVTPSQLTSVLGQKLIALKEKYDPLAMVCDTGGLGLKITEDLNAMYELYLVAAKKTDKNGNYRLLNSSLKTGEFQAKADSQFANDCKRLSWKEGMEYSKVSDSFHSDIIDAVLYAFRQCPNYINEKIPIPSKLDNFQQEHERMLAYRREDAGKLIEDED